MRIQPALASRWKRHCYILPDLWYQFIDRREMEALVGMGGKPEPGIWYRMHATDGISSDCATRALSEKHEEITL